MDLHELPIGRSVAATAGKGIFGLAAPVLAWKWTEVLATGLHLAALVVGIGVSLLTGYSILRDIRRKDRREIDYANRADRRAALEAMWAAKRASKSKHQRRTG